MESCGTKTIKVVHLPVYAVNAYQELLMAALRAQGITVIDGGGGGNFFRTALLKWKPGILHFHWLHPYLLRPSVLGSMARATRFLCEVHTLRLAGIRIVWTVHNLANHDRRHMRLEKFFTTRFAQCADGVIAHSPTALAAAKEAFQIGGEKLTAVIPQGSYIGCYPNKITKPECRRQLMLPDDAFVFVLMGRIEPYKGVLDLIHDFRKLGGAVNLLIAGRVSSPELLKLIHDAINGSANIHLHEGFIPDDRVQLFLNAADAYVYPVREILNPGSIALAMSFGLPCVAPKLPAVLDAMGEDGGLLYDLENPDALVDAMRQAIVQKEELEWMGAVNLAQARERTWEKTGQSTLQFYKRCLAA